MADANILKKYGVNQDEEILNKYTTPLSQAFQKAETFRVRPPFLERASISLKRKGALATKAILGDIPYVRKLLPEVVKQMQPGPTSEKVLAPLARFGRDIGIIASTSGLGASLGKAKYLKYAPDFIRGAAFGAVTAGTEDPTQIAKEAGKMGTIFAAIPLAIKGVAKGGQRAWRAVPAPIRGKAEALAGKIGQSVGLHIKESVKAYQLVRQRYQDIWREKLKSDVFRRTLLQRITPKEDALLPFIREKALPKGIALTAAQKAKLNPIAKEVGNYLDDAHKFIVDNYGDDVGFVKNYIPHIWNIPKNKQRDVVHWFTTRNPHLKARRVETIKAGIEKFGLKPKYTKMSDIIKVYDEYRIKTAANVKFVEQLKGLENNLKVKLVQRADKAPVDWVTVDNPVLARGVFRGAVGKEKIPVIQKIPVKVHPDIADAIKTVMGRGWDRKTTSNFLGSVLRGMTKVNAFGKYMNLTASLFHHVALAETAIAAGIGGRLTKMVTAPLLHPVRTWKAIKSRNYGAFRNLPLTKDAVHHGLQIGAIADVQRNVIERSLLNMEQGLKQRGLIGKALGAPVAGVRKAVEFWNRSLWDYYHTELKLMGYEKLVADNLKKFPNLPSTAVKQEVAQFVNDTFGGQAWDLLLKSPKWRQSMHWLLLSPDWTLSTVRQALSPFGVGATSAITKELRKDLGTEFWKRAIVYFWGGMNLLNYGLTKAYQGQGRYMWDNPPKTTTKLFVGYNPDGTEAYLRWGKQFRELPEFFIDPFNKFKGKASPILRQAFAQVFPNEYYQREIVQTKGLANIKARTKEMAKFVAPYSLQNIARRGLSPLSAFTFAMPISRGMTPYKTTKLFERAIAQEDMHEIRRTRDAALRSGLNAEQLFKQARANIKRDKTFEAKKNAYRIYQDLIRMPQDKRREYFLSLKKDGTITEDIARQLNKIVITEREVAEQKQKVGIR